MSSTNFKVLVCDDSILARKQLSDAIRECVNDVEIIEATNGQDCVDKYKSVNPDIVFIDIVMPVLDGVGAVESIIGINPNAIVVIVSSVGTKNELKKAIEAGAHDFIQKPYSAPQIHEVISYYKDKL